MVTFREKFDRLPKERQDRISARAAELKAEELTLQQVRKAMDFSQEQLARTLDIKQANVSQMEARADLLISTVRSYIEAMGGRLDLIATFKDRPPVRLAGFSDLRDANELKKSAAADDTPSAPVRDSRLGRAGSRTVVQVPEIDVAAKSGKKSTAARP
jgi:hypothetical protein